MFLTRKALRKIRIITGLYFVFSVISLVLSIIDAYLNMDFVFGIILGIVCFTFGLIFPKIGKYAEGKGKLINKGNKIINQQLKPAEFICLYQETCNCTENIISKPDFDVLHMLAMAYDALADTENELAVIEDMLAIASDKKKPLVYLLKSSVLFSIGKKEEAEQLFTKAQNSKLDFRAKISADMIYKCDRAITYGDYNMAENYNKQILLVSNSKKKPLILLYAHFNLAEIYYKTNRFEEAKTHYRYCAENGGETAIRVDALKKINELK